MIKIGAASKVINNELGRPVQGASVNQIAKSIRDDLEANALFLGTESESVLLISVDLAAVLTPRAAAAREAIAAATGMPARSIIIAGTHTHAGPSVIPTNYLKPLDTAYLDRLHGWLVEVGTEAVASARPGRIGWGLGSVQIGYNRRCCWADGTHSMHGDTTRGDFTGLEGPVDTSHLALFARDAGNKVVAVFHNNTSHPTCFYGADFYSADFPGTARTFLREVLGPIPVLFFNGAFGDISIGSQEAPRDLPEAREQNMLRAAHLVAGETLRLLHEAGCCESPVLAHAFDDVAVSVRLPDPERVTWAREVLARCDAGEETNAWNIMFAYATRMLHEEYGGDPVDHVPVHAIRIGDVGLATQSCELYCQFGLDIKRRSPAPLTAVCGVADGYNGYCPTTAGVLGGGYSGEAFHWARLAADAGYRITDAAARLLHQLWRA